MDLTRVCASERVWAAILERPSAGMWATPMECQSWSAERECAAQDDSAHRSVRRSDSDPQSTRTHCPTTLRFRTPTPFRIASNTRMSRLWRC